VTTAFVLSGGGSLGAVQVGMLQALADHRVRPDLLVGTSAGALNAAFVAGHGADRAGVDALAAVWTGLRARSVFRFDLRQAVGALAGRRSAVCDDRGLRDLLRRHLLFTDLRDSPIPLVVVATDLLSGQEVALSTGDGATAILASCAIPGVLPAVEVAGRSLVDGGLANNTAVSQAVAAGADTVYVLPSGYSCALPAPPRTPLGTVLHAVTTLMHQRLVTDVALYEEKVRLVVLPPPCPIRISPMDFGRAGELIRRAHRDAHQALSVAGGRRIHPERHVAMHDHERSTGHRSVSAAR